MAVLVDEHKQWLDGNLPIVNGKVFVGTQGNNPTTGYPDAPVNLITIYSDRELTTAITNPQATDADGRTVNKIWIPDVEYSLVVWDSDDVQKYISLNEGKTGSYEFGSVTELIAQEGSEDGQIAYLKGYYAVGDGGQGEIYWDATSTETADNGMIFQVTGVTTGRWKRPEDEVITFKKYGAKGDDSFDDTAYIQAAINKHITLTGGGLFPDDGTYKITDELSIPYSARWLMEGESRGGVIIKQYTLNKPIFRFTTANTHSWSIKSMTLNYNTQQTSTQTDSVPIYFPVDSGSPGAGYYNFIIDDLYIDNCYRCIAHDSISKAAVWGGVIDNLVVGENVTGSAVYFGETSSLGLPSNHFGKIYILSNSMEAGENIFDLVGCKNTTMNNIEVNTVTNGCRIINASEGTSIDINSFKVEGGTYSTTGARLFDCVDSFINIGTLRLTTLTFNPGASNDVSILGHSAGTGKYQIKSLSIESITITSGVVYVAQGASSGGNYLRGAMIDYFDPADVITNMHLTDLPASSGADGVMVKNWMEPRISGDKGDADYTVNIGDSTIIRYDTALTALRTVTLQSLSGSAEGSVFNGLSYTVLRSGAGAFDLDIKSSGGAVIDTIPSGNTGAITFAYRRFAWEITSRYLV